MKILLIRPPFARLLGSSAYATYPLGLMGVAAMLKQRAHEVQIYHDDVSWGCGIPARPPHFQDIIIQPPDEHMLASLGEVLKREQPDVVGIGYCTADRGSARATAEFVRENCSARLVAGGVHPSLLPEQELDIFSAVVVGEGDSPQAAAAFEADVRGLVVVPPIHDLDAVLADRTCVIGHERYPRFLQGMIQTQRGCPYNCGFCAAPKIFGTKVRLRDPARVREEVEHLGLRDGRIIDDSFGVIREHGLKVCWELAKTRYRWICDVALQDVDDERIDMWLRAGCHQINIGIESGVTRWQKLSGKNIPLGRPEEVVKQCVKQGLSVVFYFMIGYPGETLSELKSTLAYARRLKSFGGKPCISIMTPYPKTKIWDMVPQTDDYSAFLHQSAKMGFADCTPDEWAQIVEEADQVSM